MRLSWWIFQNLKFVRKSLPCFLIMRILHQKCRFHNQANLHCEAGYKRADLISLKSWHHEKKKVGKLSRIKILKRLNQILFFKKPALKIFWGQLEKFEYGVGLNFRWFGRFLLVFLGVKMALGLYRRMQAYS